MLAAHPAPFQCCHLPRASPGLAVGVRVLTCGSRSANRVLRARRASSMAAAQAAAEPLTLSEDMAVNLGGLEGGWFQGWVLGVGWLVGRLQLAGLVLQQVQQHAGSRQ